MNKDSLGQWPSWNDFCNALKSVCDAITKPGSIVFTTEFGETLVESAVNNFELDVGVGFGIGFEADVENVGVEAITRIDVISFQVKDGQVRFGHDGRSALSINILGVTVGPQNDVFEHFNDRTKNEYEETCIDIGPSYGHAAYYVVGCHVNASYSVLGLFNDVANYISERW